jgi:hypothetical protein
MNYDVIMIALWIIRIMIMEFVRVEADTKQPPSFTIIT